MASGTGPALAHRSIANIRTGSEHGQRGHATPNTPTRPLTTTYGSPSSLRAEDDNIVIEIGSRYLRAGFAGDSVPKASLQCGMEDQRRVGDFRTWQGQRKRNADEWAAEHELWRLDLRTVDLGLSQDKLERIVRDAFTKHLLIDSRPRRLGLVLDSAVPVPVLTAVLDTLFNRFPIPTISLMSCATMSAVAAGVRSALVINLGWAETVVTSVYEYREVKSTRTVRSGNFLLESLYKVLRTMVKGESAENENERFMSFSECEDIMCRLMWCRPSASKSPQKPAAQLETVEEQDESEAEKPQEAAPTATGVANVTINTATPPTRVTIPFEKIADICDSTFLDPSAAHPTFDDHELPVHSLVYQHLLQLPLDVRAVCMSRITFTGGCSGILGIKERIIDELQAIIAKRGWEPVIGKGVDQLRSNPKLKRNNATSGPGGGSTSESEEAPESVTQTAANSAREHDPIEAKIFRNRETTRQMEGEVRVIHSLGPWAGGSLLCQLKIPATATIEKEHWMQLGPYGATRPNEVDSKAYHRSSMGTGGLMRGSGGHHSNWTLGTWGYL